MALRWEHSAITTWIFDSVICWCIKGLHCCMSMTRSKLAWLHGLFGDDILITQQYFVFSEKHVICFSYKSHDFTHLCDFVTKFGYAVWCSMKILFHEWNLNCLKNKKIIKVPWRILFLYSKKSVQNSFLECPVVFCVWPDLWPVALTCDLHFSPADLEFMILDT